MKRPDCKAQPPYLDGRAAVAPPTIIPEPGANASRPLLSKLAHVHAQLVLLRVSHHLVPGHFSPQPAGHPAEHCASSCLDTGFYLVVEPTGDNALDECLILLRVRARKVVAECAI